MQSFDQGLIYIPEDIKSYRTQYRRIDKKNLNNRFNTLCDQYRMNQDPKFINELEMHCDLPYLDANIFEQDYIDILHKVRIIHNLNGMKMQSLSVFEKLIDLKPFMKRVLRDLFSNQNEQKKSIHEVCDFINQKQFKINEKQFKFYSPTILKFFFKDNSIDELKAISKDKIFNLKEVEIPFQLLIDRVQQYLPSVKPNELKLDPKEKEQPKKHFLNLPKYADSDLKQQIDQKEPLESTQKEMDNRILDDDLLNEVNEPSKDEEEVEEEETKEANKKNFKINEPESDEEVKRKEEDNDDANGILDDLNNSEPKHNDSLNLEDGDILGGNHDEKKNPFEIDILENAFENINSKENNKKLTTINHSLKKNELNIDKEHSISKPLNNKSDDSCKIEQNKNYEEKKRNDEDELSRSKDNGLLEIKKRLGDVKSLINESKNIAECSIALCYYMVDFIIPKNKMISKSVKSIEIIRGKITLICDNCKLPKLENIIKRSKIKGIKETIVSCKFCSEQKAAKESDDNKQKESNDQNENKDLSSSVGFKNNELEISKPLKESRNNATNNLFKYDLKAFFRISNNIIFLYKITIQLLIILVIYRFFSYSPKEKIN